MKVYINAFEMHTTGAVSIPDFLKDLRRTEFDNFEFEERKRALVFKEVDSHTIGVLVSTRNQHNFLVMQTNDKGEAVLKVQSTTPDSPMADMSFFVIRSDSGKGAVSTYFGGGGMTVFEKILSQKYAVSLAEKREIELEELTEEKGDKLSEKEEKKLKTKYRRKLIHLRSILTEPEFAKELQKASEVLSFEYSEPTVHDNRFSPINRQVKFQHRVIHFKHGKTYNQPAAVIKKFLIDFVSREDVEKGKARGVTSNGADVLAMIHKEAFCLAKYEHDEVVRSENINLAKLSSCPMIKQMLGLVKARGELFEPKKTG